MKPRITSNTDPITYYCLITVVLFLIGTTSLSGCRKPPEQTRLDRILESGEITAIMRNNAHCYYLNRGQAMGFEYDMAKTFADFLGVKLNVIIIERWDDMVRELLNGNGDFIAANIPVTPMKKQQVSFSENYMTIQQHIVSRRHTKPVNKIEDLSGKSIDVRRGSSYHERLDTMKNRGIDITLNLHEELSADQLIKMVADKQIDMTVADSNIAFMNRRYYPHAINSFPVGWEESLAWAVEPGSDFLRDRMSYFFEIIKENKKFDEIYNRYYSNIEDVDYVDLWIFHKRIKEKLPRYIHQIRQASEKYHFDWRLITAQIYQESHFKPNSRSHAGAYGLMQLVPATARSLGVERIWDPEENIEAGVRHLRALHDNYMGETEQDRLLISLAAYNIGQGHMYDAINLAKKMGLDPLKWSSIEQVLPLLRFRKYYQDAAYGFCLGTEPVTYTRQIMIYYDILKQREDIYRTLYRSRRGNKKPPKI
ncbi:MAG: membrane-bound lytic murein transglycosylase MltF [Desulfobacterales bacterium]|nr:membrane-bound lytic murein transglycosylase MltF [Desulfobacterales bacterium]